MFTDEAFYAPLTREDYRWIAAGNDHRIFGMLTELDEHKDTLSTMEDDNPQRARVQAYITDLNLALSNRTPVNAITDPVLREARKIPVIHTHDNPSEFPIAS